METTAHPLLESGIDTPVPCSSSVDPRLETMLTMTRQLFPGEVVVRRKADPEIAEEAFYSIRVRASGSVADVVAKDRQWHERLVEIVPESAGLFRLSMEVP